MTVHKIVFLGNASSGKSQLVKQLVHPNAAFESNSRPTVGVDFFGLNKNDGDRFQLWDVAGQRRFEPMTSAYLNETSVGVICVSLADSFEESNIEAIKETVQLILSYSPDAPIILVGTKADSPDISYDNLEKINSLGLFSDVIVTSAKEKTGIEDLFSRISNLCKLRQDSEEEVIDENQSEWTKAIEKLAVELNNLPIDKKELIDKELGLLSAALTRASDDLLLESQERVNAITTFSNNCEQILEGKYSSVLNTVFTIVAVAFITTVAAAIGFGIGFACGWWTGPGAFFTGLAAGYAAATTVTAMSVGLGLAGGGLTAYGLFKKSNEMAAINEFTVDIALAM